MSRLSTAAQAEQPQDPLGISGTEIEHLRAPANARSAGLPLDWRDDEWSLHIRAFALCAESSEHQTEALSWIEADFPQRPGRHDNYRALLLQVSMAAECGFPTTRVRAERLQVAWRTLVLDRLLNDPDWTDAPFGRPAEGFLGRLEAGERVRWTKVLRDGWISVLRRALAEIEPAASKSSEEGTQECGLDASQVRRSASHAGDFAWIETKAGVRYDFTTARQREIVEALYPVWVRGGDGAPMTEAAIDDGVSRVRVAERFKGNAALGTILCRHGSGGCQGSCRLS